MLLFIRSKHVKAFTVWLFQYISCYSLSILHKAWISSVCVSIHLMLLFIPVCRTPVICHRIVSIHLMLLFIRTGIVYIYRINSFNTSHVTLYLVDEGIVYPLSRFQYISCYSLSMFLVCHSHYEHCFNTSHVTLYLAVKVHNLCWFMVSIHLMLLFIWSHLNSHSLFSFQYISCYSLS